MLTRLFQLLSQRKSFDQMHNAIIMKRLAEFHRLALAPFAPGDVCTSPRAAAWGSGVPKQEKNVS